MDEWQSKKLLPSWTVQKMSGDPEIINALIPMTTPSQYRVLDYVLMSDLIPPGDQDQTSDASVTDTNVSQLDLAYVTDDNETPSKLLKRITIPNDKSSTNKRNGDGVLGNKGSNTKKQLIDQIGDKN
ncbi:hypothetical protein CTI12_AA496890 [Artemisia annua]|uniref:Uncharacterized protein n=1 Tax=Artemisia annua TaxID=35608 RepID=A0A2U1LEZ7_ARTAN|nr:hypothetical protein CTI12_AA496890 [Artemisia annua]